MKTRSSPTSHLAETLAGLSGLCLLACQTTITPIEHDTLRGCNLSQMDGGGWVNGENAVTCLMQGSYYAYNDCKAGVVEDCTVGQWPSTSTLSKKANFEAVRRGDQNNPRWHACTNGTTAAPSSEEDRTLKWGAGIGLHLNQRDGNPQEDGAIEPMGTALGTVVGFSFDVEDATRSLKELRVEFPTAATETSAHFVSVSGGGHHTVWLEDATQGQWVVDKSPLNPADLLNIQFLVPSVIGRPIHFDFCINNLNAFLSPPMGP